MITEKDLLLDIISNAPTNSIWNISSDSWEKIPMIFSKYISKDELYGWNIKITELNRKWLIRIINREDISEKIVHQDLKINDDIIFKSYDHMSGSYIKKAFPNFDYIKSKYDNTDIEIEEM